ncbi:hypothetical protein GQ44DRAFT_296735 [Phaeosphaeriaceae sp. PMI808]|nr:hypothetical protein GQ44DRAFT_296735 [Phaeosphaeriaceae sp. PMI808]
MKLLATVFGLATLLHLSHAWVMEVTANGKSPKSETFYSREAANGCHEISTAIQRKGVHDFEFCTIQMYGCQISFYSDVGCKGDNLGHSGGRGYSWKKYPVSKEGSKMKSFRITGCHADDIPILSKVKFDTFRIVDCGSGLIARDEEVFPEIISDNTLRWAERRGTVARTVQASSLDVNEVESEISE